MASKQARRLEYMVPESQWVPDRAHSRCQSCGDAFSAANRRHHCRRCGCLVCHSCSSQRVKLCGLDHCRVCKGCRAQMRRLEEFNGVHRGAMTQNLASIDGSDSFRLYAGGRAPATVELWLSEDALLVCTRASGGRVEGRLVHQLVGVEEGIRTAELRARLKKPFLCCDGVDEDFRAREPAMFSLVFSDGSTMDLEASSPARAPAWVRRFRALLEAVVPFAKYHARAGTVGRVPALVRHESTRLREMSDLEARERRKQSVRAVQRRRSSAIRAKYQRVRTDDR